MISSKILCSDAFLALPCSAQALYVQLTLKADDDGFVNNPQQVRLSAGAKQRDLKILVERRFLMAFDGGIVLIKHWRMANSLRKDRCKAPQYPALAARVYIRENMAYTDRPQEGCVSLLEYKKGGVVAKGETTDCPNRTEENGTEKKGTEGKEAQGGAEVLGEEAPKQGQFGGAAQGPLGKEREKEKKKQARTEEEQGRQEDFERLYGAYPAERRGSRKDALAAFEKMGLSQAEIIQARQNLAYWKRSRQWLTSGGQYIPYFVNFLNRGHWRQTPQEAASLHPSGVLGEAELEIIRRTLREGGDGLGKTDSL